MDQFWAGELLDGIRVYTVSSYQKSLLIIPIAAAVGGLIVIILGAKKSANNRVS
jgi:hypothetical protein